MSPLEDIVKRLIPLLGKLERAPVPLVGGITNRNFRARFGGEDVVIRLPGKDTEMLEIDRQAERVANEVAARAEVGPTVAAMLEAPPCMVTRFLPGRAMTAAEFGAPETLVEVAATLRRFHDCGEALPVSFSPFRIVESYAERLHARGGEVPDGYEIARPTAAAVEASLSGTGHEPVPCHDDLLAANFIRGADGIRIVDWEYAGMNDRHFDLGNFAVNNGLGAEQEAILLNAYFGEPASAARLAKLRLMRFMSDFREAMWGALQGTLSDIDFDFDRYAGDHFERLRETAAEPAFGRWLKEARGSF